MIQPNELLIIERQNVASITRDGIDHTIIREVTPCEGKGFSKLISKNNNSSVSTNSVEVQFRWGHAFEHKVEANGFQYVGDDELNINSDFIVIVPSSDGSKIFGTDGGLRLEPKNNRSDFLFTTHETSREAYPPYLFKPE